MGTVIKNDNASLSKMIPTKDTTTKDTITKDKVYIVGQPESVIKNDNGNSPDKAPFQEIVSYLNEKTGKQFKHTSKPTQKHIQARWNEGFRLDDFITVIDVKVS